MGYVSRQKQCHLMNNQLVIYLLLLGDNTRSAKDISKRVLLLMEIKWCTTQNMFS